MAKQSDWDAALAHRYRTTHDGPTVPGVTTAINIIDKAGSKWAAAKLTAAYTYESYGQWDGFESISDFLKHCTGHFDRVWRDKAARGTRVHDVAERWVRGETVDVPMSDSGYVDALEAFHKEFRPNFRLAEKVVLNRELGYGGRFDFVADLKDLGVVLGDFKTGASPRPQRTLSRLLHISTAI